MRIALCTLSTHARKAPLGATHTEKLMVCWVGGDARPNPQCMCVCEACAGQLPLHTLASFMFGPEFGVKEAKWGEDDLTIVFPVKNYAYWCPQIQNWYLGPKWLFLTAPGFEPGTRRCQVRRLNP